MMNKTLQILLSGVFCWVATAAADDVEIYFNGASNTAGAPLVMFSLDYRSNLGSNICNVGYSDLGGDLFSTDFSSCAWNAEFPEFNDYFEQVEVEDGVIQFFDMLRAALRYVFTDPQLAESDMHLGLMLNHDHKNNCENDVSAGCSNGGYIAQGLTPIPDGVQSLHEKLLAVPTPQGNLSHPFQGKELYFELFRYLTGQEIYNGHVGFTDYADGCTDDNLDDNNPGSCASSDVDPYGAAWDTSIESGSRYVSPFTDDMQCSSLHVLNFMFGVSSQDADSDSAIEASRDASGLGLTLSGGTNQQFLQILEKMRGTDFADDPAWGSAPELAGNQNVTSHFVYNGNVGNTINGYAIAGGGRAIEVTNDPRVLIEELKNTFLSIIRQNSTFEAPAVTVNSYNRLAHRDEVFFALFGPELTRDWPGNLKKYRFAEVDVDVDGDGVTDKTQVSIVDANQQVAVDANGLFDTTACSFWSSCTFEPDGDHVEKGGAAENLGLNRSVYTYVGGSFSPSSPISLSLHPVHESNSEITGEHLGLTPENVGDYDGNGSQDEDDVTAARETVLRIGRGVNEYDPFVPVPKMGDPIHSRPEVIIYDGDLGDADGDGIIEPTFAIAVSTNEGYFHLFDSASGEEILSFIPKETLPLLWQINKALPTGSGATRFDTYGLDASPVVLWDDSNGDNVISSLDGDRVIAFLSQRRGGRNLYALDITEATAPKLLWHIEGGVTAGFEELGETWSTPSLSKIRESDGTVTDVLVFGGGYDDDRYDLDADDPDDGVNIGRAVYVVEAQTGVRRWAMGPAGTAETYDLELTSLEDSIPGEVRILDLYDDGVLDRLYFADIRGRIFRADFSNTPGATGFFGGGLVASLTDTSNCNWGASPNSCRLFYNSLDVAVMTGFPVAPYIQLAMGSGFRAHPKDLQTQDRFYVVYDQKVVDRIASSDYAAIYGANGYTEADNLADVTNIPGDATYASQEIALTATLTQYDINGWYIDMDQSRGEKVISESLTIGGQIFFTTYLPTSGSYADICSTGLGHGRIYLVNAFNGLPEATLGDGVTTLLEPTDTVKETQRYTALPREGMPTDPTIVFKQKNDGSIQPNLVVGTQMPLPPELIKAKPVRRTWWREE
jgi:type IV pilus assembly protein PilY1